MPPNSPSGKVFNGGRRHQEAYRHPGQHRPKEIEADWDDVCHNRPRLFARVFQCNALALPVSAEIDNRCRRFFHLEVLSPGPESRHRNGDAASDKVSQDKATYVSPVFCPGMKTFSHGLQSQQPDLIQPNDFSLRMNS
jgi:hypothetical protein